MGQNWGKATPEQKKQLTEEFKTLLVRTYASALAAYSEQKFDFRPLRAKPTDTDVTVQRARAAARRAGRSPSTTAWRRPRSGWKVYDVMVGGVSLVANYRTEFANTVRNSGIDGLIKDLQAKNQPPAAGRSDPARRAAHRGERAGDARQRRRAAGGRPPAPRRGRWRGRPRRGHRDGFGAARPRARVAARGARREARARLRQSCPRRCRPSSRLYGVEDLLLPLSRLNAIEVRGVEKRYGARAGALRRQPRRSRRANSSACSAPTAPARPR